VLAGRAWGRIAIVFCAAWTMLLFYAGRHIDLNAYQTLPELLAVIPQALTDGLAFLMFVPSPLRWGSAATIALCLAASAAVIAAVMAIPIRLRAAAFSLYFTAMTAFLAWAGANGAARVERYRPMIERSRAFAAIAGREIGEQNLYENEILYLRKTGRTAEAERTSEELRRVMQRREEALRAAGIEP
ncbi:MAG TPA: hypothetical protein VFT12_05105, partial [Thermoanaerobaculia bacterium]|nr:hypothetical protein [Thermoanaerobaculia bacterium]